VVGLRGDAVRIVLDGREGASVVAAAFGNAGIRCCGSRKLHETFGAEIRYNGARNERSVLA